MRTSELQTELELNVTLGTRLRRDHLTELGILQVVVRGRELRSVPDVRGLRPELQAHALRDWEILKYRKVHCPQGRGGIALQSEIAAR
jgi:hypothetical protein